MTLDSSLSPSTSRRTSEYGHVDSLVDQEGRDRIAHDLDATLVVEAAAGTGKTTALIGRILSLLRSGKATMQTLVVVTFTDRAAGEMRRCLRSEIERARTRAESATEQARLGEALCHLEAAHIGTIHAFCADLLRERAVDAAIDPLFEIAADDEAARLYDEAFTLWFEQTLEAPGEGVARVLRRTPRARDQDGPREALRKAGRTLVDYRDFSTPYARPAESRASAIDDLLSRLRALAAYAPGGYQDNWLTKSLQALGRVAYEVDRREEIHASARDYDGIEAQLRTLAGYKGWNYTGGRGQWFNRAGGLTMQAVREERAAAKESLDRFLDAADADLAALLFRELWGLDAKGAPDAARPGLIRLYNALKARSGKLDFLDLRILTRDLLREGDAVRVELQQRFSHVLVDEFQDTDPLQAEIVLLLASDDPHASSLESARVVPGKLFLVGDPKQSINRFRRAELSLYETIKARLLAQGAGLVLLRTSFRSAPSLQAFVNSAFETNMRASGRMSQAVYVPLAPHRPEPVGRPTVIALPVPRPYSEYGRVTTWKIEESFPDAVGAFVDWLVRESGWTVTEPGASEPVKVGTRHVCLLFKRFQSFGNDLTLPYVRALEVRRVPHVMVGGKSFYEREEIVAVRGALSAIEWPDDAMSTYAALHGPFFALGDDALLAFRHSQRHLHSLRKRDEAKLTDLTRPVGDALEILARLHRERNLRPFADTVTQLLEATRAYAGVALWPGGEQGLANLSRVLDKARRFEQGPVTSFRGFVSHLEEGAERGGRNETPVIEEGTGGVRFMTVHEAKGLEFPIVILVDPTASATSREPSRYVDPQRGLFAVPLCGASPIELLERRQEVLEQDREEALRLLYVATTRARELLVVPVVGDERDESPASASGTARALSLGWLDALDPVLYPSDRRGSKAANGCPMFGEDSVLERGPQASRTTGSSVRPGLHRPAVGTHSVVFWDPSALDLDREDDAGQRQQKALAVDEKSAVANASIEEHARWQRERGDLLAKGSLPTLVVRTFTEGKTTRADVTSDGAFDVVIATAKADEKRFGILVHAVLAAVPLDGDASAVDRVAQLEARLLGAASDEATYARDAVLRALSHPLLERARAALRVERKTAVMICASNGALVEGVVDLAFFEAEAGWTVVDFKTDVEMASRQNDHIRQVDAYARAIAAATGQPAKGVLFAL